MHIEQISRAMETLEDIFTSDGDAVVIASDRMSRRNGILGVRVIGHFVPEAWIPIESLTAKEDL